MSPAGLLSVQHPYAIIQVSGESDPEQVGNLHPGGQRVDLAEGDNHPQDQPPQNQQPDQCGAEGLQIEKQNAPKEVKGELEQEDAQAIGALTRGGSQVDPSGPNSHQSKQNAPDDGKYKGGRGKRGLNDTFTVRLCSIPGQPAGQAACRLGKQNPGGVDFPCMMLHIRSPGDSICGRSG